MLNVSAMCVSSLSQRATTRRTTPGTATPENMGHQPRRPAPSGPRRGASAAAAVAAQLALSLSLLVLLLQSAADAAVDAKNTGNTGGANATNSTEASAATADGPNNNNTNGSAAAAAPPADAGAAAEQPLSVVGGCEACCDGGDCSAAFKGTEGRASHHSPFHLNAQSDCLPSISARSRSLFRATGVTGRNGQGASRGPGAGFVLRVAQRHALLLPRHRLPLRRRGRVQTHVCLLIVTRTHSPAHPAPWMGRCWLTPG